MAYSRDANCLTPIMTSNNAPSGVASASTEYAGYEAYKALNGGLVNYTDAWATSTEITGWWQYTFTAPTKVNYINIYPRPQLTNQAPKDFAVLGSNNGTNFITLLTISNYTSWV